MVAYICSPSTCVWVCVCACVCVGWGAEARDHQISMWVPRRNSSSGQLLHHAVQHAMQGCNSQSERKHFDLKNRNQQQQRNTLYHILQGFWKFIVFNHSLAKTSCLLVFFIKLFTVVPNLVLYIKRVSEKFQYFQSKLRLWTSKREGNKLTKQSLSHHNTFELIKKKAANS